MIRYIYRPGYTMIAEFDDDGFFEEIFSVIHSWRGYYRWCFEGGTPITKDKYQWLIPDIERGTTREFVKDGFPAFPFVVFADVDSMQYETLKPKLIPREAVALLQTTLIGMCRWVYDEAHSKWETGCGMGFQLIGDDHPYKHGMLYCPYCAQPLQTKR